MQAEKLAYYPFISEASAHVENLGISLESLLNSRAYRAARARGIERVKEALEGEIKKSPVSGETQVLSELLSYPFARMLVACVDDQLFTRRYSLAEAKAAYTFLRTETPEFLLEFGEDFEISADFRDSYFSMHFTDYIRFSNSLKDPTWKLTNRQLRAGKIKITKEEFARLLEEAVRERIEQSFPIPEIPPEVSSFCSPYVSEIKEQFEVQKKNFGATDFGAVEPDLFPPCIAHALANVQGGVNLAHSMRFAMTSFLLSVGMSVEEILNLFNVSPDFDAEKTLYQIEHIAGATGNVYKPPACDTMRTYGNCVGKDGLCATISHPLGYYEKKVYFKNRDKEKEQEKEKEKENEEKNEVEKEKEKSRKEQEKEKGKT
ncbi:MAG: DNA primase regulatory subunit PriL [Methanosarcina sp.]|uniref:DNA primase regulatory subunit PriL n=1 Tax=Methanosarcina sp. TaxID=2213 RepID=UPI002635C5FA|nr:DNA primase regulatory subunit PriL [Methanosarcina sp.]MDD3246657.1 DNA primase regulatory subunit PriL [Methanosarcina sp.]MDD4247781.1 DNA primase regulatory subunit PriL [Methanosarcina sp.]